jgi:hypothetical protein
MFCKISYWNQIGLIESDYMSLRELIPSVKNPSSDNANKVASAIRAKLSEDTAQQRAVPVIDDTVGAYLFITLPCEGYISGVSGSANALEQAEKKIKETLLAFDYEKQI